MKGEVGRQYTARHSVTHSDRPAKAPVGASWRVASIRLLAH